MLLIIFYHRDVSGCLQDKLLKIAVLAIFVGKKITQIRLSGNRSCQVETAAFKRIHKLEVRYNSIIKIMKTVSNIFHKCLNPLKRA